MKKLSRAVAVVLAVVMLAGIALIAPVTASAATPAWKTAYINYVNKMSSAINNGGWGWIKDLDGNGVPELFLAYGNGSMGGGEVISYSNNQLENVSTSGAYGVIYVKDNMFYFSHGRQGVYGDEVYRQNAASTLIFTGSRSIKSWSLDFDNPNNYNYSYGYSESSKQSASYTQYQNALNSIFDKSKAGVLNYKNCYHTTSQIISAINNYITSLSAPAVSLSNKANGIYAAWGKVANAAKYIVYYKKSSDSNWSSFETSNNYCTLQSVASGNLYAVQVQGVATNGVKGSYSKAKFMTFIATPSITSLSYNGNNNLKWTAVSGANKYQVARLKTGDKGYSYFLTNTNSFKENANGGIAYTYQVRAMYATTNSGTAYGAWSSAKSVGTLVAPTVTLSNQGNAVVAKWNSIKGTVKYVVYFKTASASGWKSATVTGTSIPITGVVARTTYYVQVRPIGSAVSGPYSAAKSIKFIPTTSPVLTLSNKSNGIRAEWKAIGGATKYIVYYKKASAGSWSSVQTSNTYYPLLNLTKGVNYYVQVQPLFGNDRGAYSAVKSLVYNPVTSNGGSSKTGTTYVLNTKTHKFHYSSCKYVPEINYENKTYYNGTRQQVINMGYEPCKVCNP